MSLRAIILCMFLAYNTSGQTNTLVTEFDVIHNSITIHYYNNLKRITLYQSNDTATYKTVTYYDSNKNILKIDYYFNNGIYKSMALEQKKDSSYIYIKETSGTILWDNTRVVSKYDDKGRLIEKMRYLPRHLIRKRKIISWDKYFYIDNVTF